MKSVITASDIIKLLEARSKARGELFFSEICIQENKQRVDGWAVKPNFEKKDITTGYEIKVNRHDFISDNKWQNYLEICNSFYFVCPKDLIARDEVPEEAGLIYATEKRLFEIKKAPYRERVFDKFLIGLIINRIARAKPPLTRIERIDNAKKLMEKERDAQEIGSKIAYILGMKMIQLKRENNELQYENTQYKKVKEFVESMGLKNFHFSIESFVYEVKKIVEADIKNLLLEKETILRTMKHLGQGYKRALELLENGKKDMETIERVVEIFEIDFLTKGEQ